MWLRDSLAYDLIFDNDGPPVAQIMIYGYESSLPASDSFQNLEDLTTSFHTALLALVQSRENVSYLRHSSLDK
jgi:protein SERAC1